MHNQPQTRAWLAGGCTGRDDPLAGLRVAGGCVQIAAAHAGVQGLQWEECLDVMKSGAGHNSCDVWKKQKKAGAGACGDLGWTSSTGRPLGGAGLKVTVKVIPAGLTAVVMQSINYATL